MNTLINSIVIYSWVGIIFLVFTYLLIPSVFEKLFMESRTPKTMMAMVFVSMIICWPLVLYIIVKDVFKTIKRKRK